MSAIDFLFARQVLDSRGNPTIEVEMGLESGAMGSAIVPSGASTGKHEAVELRDGDKSVYMGKGVMKAVKNVNEILNAALMGNDYVTQEDLDQKLCELDGTEQKSNLGANALLGVSMAFAKAMADENNQMLFEYFAEIGGVSSYVLPTPMMNVINGGAHADSGLEIQEFMVFPTGAKTFSESVQIGAEVFHTLKKILAEKKLVTAVGDEGGFAPHLENNEQAIELILEAAEKAGHKEKIQIALDAAASEFYKDGKYTIDGKQKTAQELKEYYEDLCTRYPIISIEDAFAEDDFEGFTMLQASLGDKVQLVGDDLFVTNPKRVQMGIDKKMANALLVKMNQIGTITETIEAVKMAQNEGWNAVISHRSGESEDTTIADLAVGLAAGQIKTGSLCRSERIAKYNQLLRIEEMLIDEQGAAVFQGKVK